MGAASVGCYNLIGITFLGRSQTVTRIKRSICMEYKLHRLAPNSEGWVRPSRGRLGADGVGSYVKAHGFGYEDWNFNFDLASNGKMLGYTVARPSTKFVGEEFRLILVTYDAEGWKAVGYYNGAIFNELTDRSVIAITAT
jgi:hypothetical protein